MDCLNSIVNENNHQTRKIYSVSELTSAVRLLLEGHYPFIWIEGEISNFSCPSSGHMYFTLKDQNAQIRCAMFRGRNRILNFTPENGLQVLLLAKTSLYQARGDFQLIVEAMELAGDGALLRAFELLKAKLAKEGLFEQHCKQALPSLPNRIGVITSPTGAAIRDVLSVLKRRFPAIPIIIYPSSVQGNAATGELLSAIQCANHRKECDVLLLVRGGGSLEDLWPFNEEALARAIFASKIPIICGVGHEVDFTIADFVADARAPTPSVAAEMVVPHAEDLLQQVNHQCHRLTTMMRHHLQHWQQLLYHTRARLQHPRSKLQEQNQRLDEWQIRLYTGMKFYLRHCWHELQSLYRALQSNNPKLITQQQKQTINYLQQRLVMAQRQLLKQKQQQFNYMTHALNAVSPLATLDRGYAIVKNASKGANGQVSNKSILIRVKQVNKTDHINVLLADGILNCQVDEIHYCNPLNNPQ